MDTVLLLEHIFLHINHKEIVIKSHYKDGNKLIVLYWFRKNFLNPYVRNKPRRMEIPLEGGVSC